MQYDKLIKKIEKSYDNFLISKLKNEPFDLTFSIPKISIKWNIKLINEDQIKLKQLSQKQSGIVLNTTLTTKWTIVESISFQDEIYYLQHLWKTKDFVNFQKNLDTIQASNIQALLFWIGKFDNFLAKNISIINEYNGKWSDILLVVEYFLLHKNSWVYLRELPIPIHTKFIENHKKIICSILDFLAFPLWNTYEWNSFEEKFWIKTKPKMIRFRFLQNTLKQAYFSYFIDDITLKIEDFEKLSIPFLQNVYIVENEINYLTFPKKECSIIIWGKWFDISRVKYISWLLDKEIIYFWDLDSHGFKILSQCRKYLPQTKSICMDWQTYRKFEKYVGKGENISVDECEKISEFLTTEESEILKYVNEHCLRLEQENISQEYLKRWI